MMEGRECGSDAVYAAMEEEDASETLR